MDSAAQGSDRPGSDRPGSDRKVICERCFAKVPASSLVCPECGAPIGDVAGHATESAVHPELAQANLLRMRGDFDAAEKLCLSILKRYPNEPEAHVLLGELCQDRGDWQRAVEWFELAVDLNPNSAADQAKLDEARRHIEETETAETVEQLGLPEHTTKFPLSAALVIGIVILAGIATFANRMQNRPGPPPIDQTLVAPITDPSTDTANQTPDNPDNNTPPSPNPGHSSMPMEDRTLLALLQKRSADGDKVTAILKDPRYQTITLSYDVPSDGDPRKIGATLAKDALDQDPDALVVTVQGSSNSQVVYTADATRVKLQEIEASNSNGDDKSDPDAWIAKLLQNEWTPESGPKDKSDKPKDKDATAQGSTDESTPATSSGSESPPPGADASTTSSSTSSTPPSTQPTKSGS